MSGILSPCVYYPIAERCDPSETRVLQETNSRWDAIIRRLNISPRISTSIPEDTRPEGLCLHTLNGHTGWVLSCDFSPDGTQIASASSDKTVILWSASTGKLLHILNGHTGWVVSCVFSPDGTQIASASSDKTAILWSASTGKPLHILNGHLGQILSCTFSPDGAQIVSADSDQIAIFWNTSTGERLHTLRVHTETLPPRVFSPDEIKEATAVRSSDRTVRLWKASTNGAVSLSNAYTGELLYILNGHTKPITSCVFNPDGKTIASTSYDKTVKVWLCAKSWWLNLLWNRLEANKQPWETFTRIALSRIQKDLRILHHPQWEQYISSLRFQIAALPKSIDSSDRLRFLESSEAVLRSAPLEREEAASRSAILQEEEVARANLFNSFASQRTPHPNAASTH